MYPANSKQSVLVKRRVIINIADVVKKDIGKCVTNTCQCILYFVSTLQKLWCHLKIFPLSHR